MPIFIETEKVGKLGLKDAIEKSMDRRNNMSTEKYDEGIENMIEVTNELQVRHTVFECEVIVKTREEITLRQDKIEFKLVTKGKNGTKIYVVTKD